MEKNIILVLTIAGLECEINNKQENQSPWFVIHEGEECTIKEISDKSPVVIINQVDYPEIDLIISKAELNDCFKVK